MDSPIIIFLVALSVFCWLVALFDKNSWPIVRALAPFAVVGLLVYLVLGVIPATHNSYGVNDIRVGPAVAVTIIFGYLVMVAGISRAKPDTRQRLAGR